MMRRVTILAAMAFFMAGMPLFAGPGKPKVPQLRDQVVVLGVVAEPCVIPYTRDVTVMTAINAAGGANQFENPEVYLIRKGKARLVNLQAIRENPNDDIRLQPWDIVCVREPSL